MNFKKFILGVTVLFISNSVLSQDCKTDWDDAIYFGKEAVSQAKKSERFFEYAVKEDEKQKTNIDYYCADLESAFSYVGVAKETYAMARRAWQAAEKTCNSNDRQTIRSYINSISRDRKKITVLFHKSINEYIDRCKSI